MVKYSELSDEQKSELLFTSEERQQLAEAKKRPIVYDADCPAVSPEKAKKFRRVHPLTEEKRA